MTKPVLTSGLVWTLLLFGQYTSPSAAQSFPAPQQDEASDQRPISFGVRVSGFLLDAVKESTLERSESDPVVSRTYTTTSQSSSMGLGPTLEFHLGPKITLGVEALLHRARYEKVTEMYEGVDNENTSGDERDKTSLTERTKANLWDIPILLRYHGLGRRGWTSRMFISGGAALRSVASVRTGREAVFPDDSTSYREDIPEEPAKRNVAGAMAGMGFRFVTVHNIKLSPELRYIRWFGSTFDSDSTHSGENQLEFGVGITF